MNLHRFFFEFFYGANHVSICGRIFFFKYAKLIYHSSRATSSLTNINCCSKDSWWSFIRKLIISFVTSTRMKHSHFCRYIVYNYFQCKKKSSESYAYGYLTIHFQSIAMEYHSAIVFCINCCKNGIVQTPRSNTKLVASHFLAFILVWWHEFEFGLLIYLFNICLSDNIKFHSYIVN